MTKINGFTIAPAGNGQRWRAKLTGDARIAIVHEGEGLCTVMRETRRMQNRNGAIGRFMTWIPYPSATRVEPAVAIKKYRKERDKHKTDRA